MRARNWFDSNSPHDGGHGPRAESPTQAIQNYLLGPFVLLPCFNREEDVREGDVDRNRRSDPAFECTCCKQRKKDKLL